MKTMRVPVLVFENSDDVDILVEALYNYNENQNKYSKTKVQERLNEIYKIQTIFEKTNNN
jgi:3-methyladenine DNA glycosylase AlkC